MEYKKTLSVNHNKEVWDCIYWHPCTSPLRQLFHLKVRDWENHLSIPSWINLHDYSSTIQLERNKLAFGYRSERRREVLPLDKGTFRDLRTIKGAIDRLLNEAFRFWLPWMDWIENQDPHSRVSQEIVFLIRRVFLSELERTKLFDPQGSSRNPGLLQTR